MITTLVVVGALILLAGGALLIAKTRKSTPKTVAWWAVNNGFTALTGTPELLGLFHGEPFGGAAGSIQSLYTGQLAARPALILQFGTFGQQTGFAQDTTSGGGRSVVAIMVELPAPVPELAVRRELAADRLRGQDLQLESVQFNQEFRIDTEHRRFAYDVLNARMMQFLLNDQRSSIYRFRIDGSNLIVWRDGVLTDPEELPAFTDYVTTLLSFIPHFVYTMGWRPEHPRPGVSAIPRPALGTVPVNTVAAVRYLHRNGRDWVVFEQNMDVKSGKGWRVIAKTGTPTPWPVLVMMPKAFGPAGRLPRFDDQVLSGNTVFDGMIASGSPDPDFARDVLAPDLVGWMTADPRTPDVQVILNTEIDRVFTDGTPQGTLRGLARGRIDDPGLADRLIDYLTDLAPRIPQPAYRYRFDRDRSQAPAG